MRSLLLALAVLLLAAVPAAAEPVPDGYAYTDHWFDSSDGTRLHAGVFLPADHRPGERHPTIMVIGPYTAPNGGATGPLAGGSHTSGVPIRFPELFTDAKILEDRWAYVQVDSRGFGGSGGCFEYYGPGELRDARAAVEWAAGRDWSTGKVALYGKSYDAASGVLGLAADPEGLAAVVTQAPGLSAYTALWHGGVHYATGRYATTPLYTADDLTPPQNGDTLASQDYALAYADGVTSPPTCRVDSVVGMNTVGDRDDPFWALREPYLGAKGSRVPTFWTHGFFDANTKPVHLDVWSQLEGPKQAWFGQFRHLRGQETGRGEAFIPEMMRFLDEHVRGVRSPQRDPRVTIEQGDEDGGWRTEAVWPPRDAAGWSMPTRAGSYTDGPGNTATKATGLLSATAPLPHAAHLAGEAVLTVPVTTTVGGTRMVAHLYDVDEDGRGTLMTRGATALPGAGAQEARITLYPQDWEVGEGHRIALVVSGSDDDWYSPGVTQTSVQVGAGTLELPLLRHPRIAELEGDPSDAKGSPRRATFAASRLEAAEVPGAPPAQVGRPGGDR